MNDWQKVGGVSALIAAATWVFGMVLLFTVLAPFATGDVDPGFLADNQAIIYVWNITIYLVFGVLLVVLLLALHERLKAGAPALVGTATAFGLIWAAVVFASGMVFNIGMETVIDLYGRDPAQAKSVWLAVNSVSIGLGGGNEVVGALWILLLSWAALRAGGLPRALNYLGVVISVAGLLTLVPALEMMGIIFGLGSIVWFVWLGIVMLRGS
ncbi:MAG: DUF4386 family protein [Anaerolineales bacterium]|nr:MAG: DUF4386 family protein [Anaerolineales bacterium]